MHYDDWAQQYDKDVAGWDYHAPDQILNKINQFVSSHPERLKMLDVGIGTGLLSSKCRELRDNIEISGIDISSRMLAICEQQKVADHLYRLDVSKQRFPFEEDSFDIVTAAGLMENVDQIENALIEMARVVRPGGLIAFTYMPTTRHPLRQKLAKKLRPGRTSEGRFVLGELNLFRHNPDIIRDTMHRHGVKSSELSSFVGYRTYVVITVRYDLFVGRKIKGLQ